MKIYGMFQDILPHNMYTPLRQDEHDRLKKCTLHVFTGLMVTYGYLQTDLRDKMRQVIALNSNIFNSIFFNG